MESRKKSKECNREWVRQYKIEKGCCVCGARDPVVLQFHHTGDKAEEVGKMVNGSRSLEKIKAEIEKCIVVCANDHLRIHHWIRKG